MSKDKTPQTHNINNGGITPEQIKMWKAKHRKIAEISVTDGDETHVGYFRRPDMETLAATNKLRKTDEIKAAEVLFKNCWLGGSQLMQEDAIIQMAATGQLNGLINISGAELKNL